MSRRWVGCIGIDPGMGDPTAIVALGGFAPNLRVVAMGTVRHRKRDTPITKMRPAQQRDEILGHAAFVELEASRQFNALHDEWTVARRTGMAGDDPLIGVALEWYEDQGPDLKRAPGRFLVPMLIGALVASSAFNLPRRAEWLVQPASLVMRLYGPALRTGKAAPAQVAGWDRLRNQHERSAALHALYGTGELRR